MAAGADRVVVTIDASIADLVPVFLGRRREEIDAIRAHVASGDWDSIRIAGHSLKGTGGGYGFDALSSIGADIEEAAKRGDQSALEDALRRMGDYLDRVEVVYEE